jgi:hypothetical protein
MAIERLRNYAIAMLVMVTLYGSCTDEVNAGTLYVNAGDTNPVAVASRSGDLALLRRQEQGTTDPEVRSIITAVIARMLGNYDDSTRVSKACFDQARSVGLTSIALVCGRVWASNYLLRGDLNRWSEATAEVWTDLKPALAKVMNTDDISLYELDFASQIPLLHYSETGVRASSRGAIVGRLVGHRTSEYLGDTLEVNGSISGSTVSMIVDTGAAFSALSDADASRLGIKPTSVSVRVRTTPEVRSSQVESSMRLAVVPKIKLGDAEVSNVIFLVGGANQSVLGLNVISKLPSPVVLSRTGIAFGQATMACDSPMITATDISGTIGTAFGMISDIDGKPSFAALDLGNNAYVEGYANALSHALSNAPTPMMTTRVDATVPSSYYTGRVRLSPGPSAQAIDAPLLVLATSKPPYDWTIGSGVLKDFSIYLDFNGHAACLSADSPSR